MPAEKGPTFSAGDVVMRTCLLAVVGSLFSASPPLAADAPTFYKDVLPILQTNCQTLPPAGRGRADVAASPSSRRGRGRKAIKKAVVSQQMPPWFADPRLRPLRQRAPAERRTTSTPSRLGGRRRPGWRPSGTRRRRSTFDERLEHQAGHRRSRCRSRSSCRPAAPSTTSTSW